MQALRDTLGVVLTDWDGRIAETGVKQRAGLLETLATNDALARDRMAVQTGGQRLRGSKTRSKAK